MSKEDFGWVAKHIIIATLIVLAVAAGAIFGTYTWQHDKVNKLSAKVSNLNSQLTTLNSQISSLNGQLNKACQSTQQSPAQNSGCSGYTYVSSKGVSALIFTPTRNAKLSSPVAVIGEVPGNWSFEAQFPVQLKDGQGNLITKASAHILGDWMTEQLVSFSVQLTYTGVASGSGTLILQKDNPSGLEKNSDSITIPVQF